MADKIKTYVNGLDPRLEGGIPKGHIVLISGTSGSMKSSLTFNIGYNYALDGFGKVLYISLEQNKESLIMHMTKLGMDFSKVENEFTILDLSWLRTELLDLSENEDDFNWFESIQEQIASYKKNLEYDILIFDSLEAMFTISNLDNPRNDIFTFFEGLRDLGITSLLLSEMPPDKRIFGTYGIESFLADGIIHLDMERSGMTVGRYIGVVKMREVKHSTEYFPLLVDNGKFRIVSK